MLGTVIVGGGLCGLALANLLRTSDYTLFEARDRLGGRILTAEGPSGLAIDLGPTWVWPDANPHISRLIRALGLGTFPQYDGGYVLHSTQFDASPQPVEALRLHEGAQRIVGGVSSLVGALAARLPAERIRLGQALTAVADRSDHVEVRFRSRGETVSVKARRAVLAVPPRLLGERVRFEPPLGQALQVAMRETPTWMAGHAKALVTFPRAFWRSVGNSGSAFATYPGAVLGEVFDACDASERPALGGFFALTAAERRVFRAGLPLLVRRQFVGLFGPEADGKGAIYIQDWATEEFTSTVRDATDPPAAPTRAEPILAMPHWGGRLLLGGSETAARDGGHLEGALGVAARIAEILGAPAVAPSRAQPSPVNQDGGSEAEPLMAEFRQWVSARRSGAMDEYRQSAQSALSRQEIDQLTQRALLEAAESVYRGALAQLASMPLESVAGATVGGGASALVDEVLSSLAGFSEDLVSAALRFNRSSCAMQNFPLEARPDREYVTAIWRDLKAAFDQFRASVESVLRSRLNHNS